MNPAQPLRTILEARRYDEPMLVIETGRGELAGHAQISAEEDAWKLTGAWRPETRIDGTHIERWLRGLRPQNGARSAQAARARERLRELAIRRTAPDQGDIVWATPHMEYPGAVTFRSLTGEGEELAPEPPPDYALSEPDLEELLDQVIEEMRRGTIDHRRLGVPPVTPSGSLPKFAVHLHPETNDWHVPGPNRLSTHIIKHEDRADVPAEAAIEAICQRTLRHLGIRAAATSARVLGHRQVIVSERSDRFVDPATGTVRPIHQEEWACACGRDPDELIQRPNTNGGWVDLYHFLSERTANADTEQEHFWAALSALALLGHRDIHRRNVAVRYARADEPYSAELAPLYDVASMDGQADPRWRSLGLPIGGEEEIERIGEKAWVRIAGECRAEPGQVLGIVSETARHLGDALQAAIGEAREDDEWREPDTALARIDALQRGTNRRARRALRPTTHSQTRPADPDWIDELILSREAGHRIELETNEKDKSLTIKVVDQAGTITTLGRAESPAAYYRALRRARAVPPEDVPHLERTLEREQRQRLAQVPEQQRSRAPDGPSD